jgi:hypoxanthine phosphoribosyltransferase
MGKNILTYEEFLNDCGFIDESNRITSLELIELLMEEERENGYYFDLDECDEGWSFGSKGRGSDRTFKFTPGKNDTDVTSTEIFNEDKKFKYHEVLLPKSGVMSYNLYKISDMRISKALKHPNKFKDIEKREIDFDSIDKFMKRTSLYIYSILKNNPVDIITYPESSSEFNKDMVEYIMDRYKKSPGIKCIPNLMSKNIRNVYVNFTVAKELGLSDADINRLRHDVENWKSDADVYDLRVKIDELNDYIAYHSGKRGRPTNDIKQKKELVKNLEEQIKILRKGRRGKDKTKSSDGKAKNFEIKSIEDKRRRSLEGLFGINPKLSGIQQDLKGKHIVIFDDNISSGATLDDICLELQKYGVASILPITLAIIPKTVYGQEHESLKNR